MERCRRNCIDVVLCVYKSKKDKSKVDEVGLGNDWFDIAYRVWGGIFEIWYCVKNGRNYTFFINVKCEIEFF